MHDALIENTVLFYKSSSQAVSLQGHSEDSTRDASRMRADSEEEAVAVAPCKSKSSRERLLYAMIKQKNLKSMDWTKVAEDPLLEGEIPNGHAARMRFSRLRATMEKKGGRYKRDEGDGDNGVQVVKHGGHNRQYEVIKAKAKNSKKGQTGAKKEKKLKIKTKGKKDILDTKIFIERSPPDNKDNVNLEPALKKEECNGISGELEDDEMDKKPSDFTLPCWQGIDDGLLFQIPPQMPEIDWQQVDTAATGLPSPPNDIQSDIFTAGLCEKATADGFIPSGTSSLASSSSSELYNDMATPPLGETVPWTMDCTFPYPDGTLHSFNHPRLLYGFGTNVFEARSFQRKP